MWWVSACVHLSFSYSVLSDRLFVLQLVFNLQLYIDWFKCLKATCACAEILSMKT